MMRHLPSWKGSFHRQDEIVKGLWQTPSVNSFETHPLAACNMRQHRSNVTRNRFGSVDHRAHEATTTVHRVRLLFENLTIIWHGVFGNLFVRRPRALSVPDARPS